MSPLSIVELSSRQDREHVLSKMAAGNLTMTDATGAAIGIARAKIAFQLKRNNNLKDVMKKLSKDPRCEDKTVNIQWQLDDCKNRTVSVDNVVAFIQSPADLRGSFQ